MKTNFFSECLDWTLLNFLNFRLKEENWTADKTKEHNTYTGTLGNITANYLGEHQSRADSALKNFTVKR